MQIVRRAVRQGDANDQIDPVDPRRAGVQEPRGLLKLSGSIAGSRTGPVITQLSPDNPHTLLLMHRLLEYVRGRVQHCAGVFRPIVITDIDGVLLRGHVPIPGTLEAVR